MRMNSILSTTAVVLGMSAAPALAAGPLSPEATGEGFAALAGVPATALSGAEMDAVVGQAGFIQLKSQLLSSASGGELLLIGGALTDLGGSFFLVKPVLGVHWESSTDLADALGGTPTRAVAQAGLGLVRSLPSVAQ